MKEEPDQLRKDVDTISQSPPAHNEPPLGRRTILAAGMMAAGGCFSELPAKCSAAANQKLRLGFVGVGNRGRNNLLPLRREDIAGLCDVDADHLSARAREFPGAKRFRDFREMIQPGRFDAIVISAPNHIHAPAIQRALRCGMHVYCEKPLTHSLQEIWQIESALKNVKTAGGRPLATQLGNQHHSRVGYQTAIHLLRKNHLGSVTAVHSWTSKPYWDQGIRRPKRSMPIPKSLHWNLWLGPAPYRPYHSCYTPMTWRGWWDFGGGALADMGPHLLDPVVAGLKLESPTEVAATTSRRFTETAPAASVVRFRFRRQGQPSLPVTWYDGGKQPSSNQTGLRRLPAHGTLIIAEKGRLFIPQLGGMPRWLNQKNQPQPLPQIKLPTLTDHHANWLTACKERQPCRSDFQYAATLTSICLLGNLAVRTGRAFKWNAKRRRSDDPVIDRLLGRQYRTGW